MSRNIILIMSIFVFWLFISFARKKEEKKKEDKLDGIMKTPQVGGNIKNFV